MSVPTHLGVEMIAAIAVVIVVIASRNKKVPSQGPGVSLLEEMALPLKATLLVWHFLWVI